MKSNVPTDGVYRVEVKGHAPIAIYELDGEYFATDDLCTHGDGALSEGAVVNGEIICPLHGGAFDIRTGRPTESPCVIPINTYTVVVEEDRIYVELSNEAETAR